MRDDLPRYTFGDSPVAARRLELLSDAYEDSTRAFLAEAAPVAPRVAVDLGCGLGASTRLLAAASRATRTIGVDTSAAFVAVATDRGVPGVTFVRRDATTVPLPGAPADLLYCRLLLAHVPDPPATVRAWATQLAPRGRLLIDEMEWIDAAHPVLVAYEAVVRGLVASRGAPMFAGPMVATVLGGPGWRQCHNGVRRVAIPAPIAARIYELNLRAWRDDPYIRDRHPSAELDGLAGDLADLAESSSSAPVVWAVRQIAFERHAPVDAAD
ncbi:MAG TPA: class I SAM-dependent methyltransferase [Acidimicrobiia bacterium]|nr:class I SAM-dependent methyltransferase [Acidimicrobiia bacterium]